MKYVGNFVATEDNKADFFSLQVRLSISAITNSLVVRISQKVMPILSVIVNFADDWFM